MSLWEKYELTVKKILPIIIAIVLLGWMLREEPEIEETAPEPPSPPGVELVPPTAPAPPPPGAEPFTPLLLAPLFPWPGVPEPPSPPL